MKMFECEICCEKNVKVLHKHHIIERTAAGTSNNEWNLAIICANCHTRVHGGEIEIIGVFSSSRPPNGRTLVFKENGICNVPGMEKEDMVFKSWGGMKVY